MNMRPGPNNKRSRGRGRGGKHHSITAAAAGAVGRGGQPDQHFNIHRTIDFERSGHQDPRQRASHLRKVSAAARDANSSGDRVMAENYLQHAEHYYRLIMAAQAAMPQPQQGQQQTGAHPYGNGSGQPQPNQAQGYNGGGQYRQPNGSGPQPGTDANGNVMDSDAETSNASEEYREEDTGRYD